MQFKQIIIYLERNETRSISIGTDGKFELIQTLNITKVHLVDEENELGNLTKLEREKSFHIGLLVGGDDGVRSRYGNTSEYPAFGNLVVVKETIVGLIHRSAYHFTCAGRTSTCTARVREIEAVLLRCVQNIRIPGTIDHFTSVRCLQSHFVRSHATQSVSAAAALLRTEKERLPDVGKRTEAGLYWLLWEEGCARHGA